jgi:hypothetical protein
MSRFVPRISGVMPFRSCAARVCGCCGHRNARMIVRVFPGNRLQADLGQGLCRGLLSALERPLIVY